jgi:hypothetical protein
MGHKVEICSALSITAKNFVMGYGPQCRMIHHHAESHELFANMLTSTGVVTLLSGLFLTQRRKVYTVLNNNIQYTVFTH